VSAVAETSRTALEIYTPVIVGLGAVVLGLLANGALEWWKSFLQRRADIRVTRQAILFEIVDLEKCAETAIFSLDDNLEKGQVVVNVSSFLIGYDREKIGRLTKDEVTSVAEIVSLMTGVISAMEAGAEGAESYRDMHIVPVRDEDGTASTMKDFFQSFRNAIQEARSTIEKHLD